MNRKIATGDEADDDGGGADGRFEEGLSVGTGPANHNNTTL